jgi:hypothetical protein
MTRPLAVFALAIAVAACDDNDDPSASRCNAAAQTGCAAGLYCEPVGTSGTACFAPVIVRGTVADPTTVTTTMLDGARVVALDANRAPVSTVAVSASGGAYELKVRAARDTRGWPLPAAITLRADRQGYQTFPGGIRPALPIDLSTATVVGSSLVVSSPLTALQLLPLPGTAATSWIAGTIARPPSGAAPLVVAEPAPGGAGPGTGITGVADRDGSYAIFNLTPGTSYVVKAYTRGANYAPVTTPGLAAGLNTVPISALPTPAPATVAGDLIFNNAASTDVDVTLVVDSTYVTTLDRGESPAGLTVPGAGGGYSFTGVPDGKYVVLAAFGIDGDVRDQSNTGNAQAPRVTVQGGAVVAAPDSFKIVPAVDLQTIGGATAGTEPIAVVSTAAPTFTWARGSVDASAQTYRVLVFDAAGDIAWSHDVAAASDNSVSYAGDALVAGMPYQLRILAISETMPVPPEAFEQLSQTEDLLGVFTYRP